MHRRQMKIIRNLVALASFLVIVCLEKMIDERKYNLSIDLHEITLPWDEFMTIYRRQMAEENIEMIKKTRAKEESDLGD